MKIQPYIEKLNTSAEYQEFRKKYGDAFLIAGFFILDLEDRRSLHQIDFYIPSLKKVAAFSIDEGITLQILDTINDKVPEKLNIKTKTDLDAIEGILEDEMRNRNITAEIKKIIAIIQNIKGKKVWNINCVLSGMEILKAHVEDETQTVLGMEKSSFMEIMKKMPGNPFQSPRGIQSQDDPITEIKKLKKLKSEIKKEEIRLKKELLKNEGKDMKKVSK